MTRFEAMFLFLWLSFHAATGATYTPCERRSLCPTSATSDELGNITLQLYINYRNNQSESAYVGSANELISKLDTSKRTVVYVSGWTESLNSLSTQTVLSAYNDRQDHNIIYVNYAHIAIRNYLYSVASINGIGYYVALGLSLLVEAGLDPNSLDVVGHSLGGQIVGYIGRYTDFELSRIIALDPAGPLFEFDGEDVSSTDAKSVLVMHTDAVFYGSPTADGSVNFYPNGGTRVQSGCPLLRLPLTADDFCDHQRSWYYWSESLRNETAFIGSECGSVSSFVKGLCVSNATAVMGYATPTTTTGHYYLQTNSASPFGRGSDGLIYELQETSITSI